ncbi:2-hydroxyacid dehydrogenase [Elioraea rosea]|uniref:2-hydroxyacid dehydrogenase n=1 Tax=Elioraea rosea TaxID=2492390 RepID=UPI0011842EC4|nr:glyoxylate/hydroxypyruvate reductase A [Elioraea rosea]
MILLVKTGGEASLPEWRSLFAELLPDLDVRWWDDPGVKPEEVAYAFLWAPDPGRLATFHNLRLIISSGAGIDHLTADPHLPAHVPVAKMGAPEAAARMREFALATVFFHHRQFHAYVANQRRKVWEEVETTEAANRTVGVMGLGSLGLPSAEALRDAGFRVKGWGRTRRDIPGIQTFGGEAGFDAFLQGTEILVCLLAATPETAGIVNARTLAKLPRGASVINGARGSHVVIEDLIAALDSGHIEAATLDVFETEPLPQDSPVWTHPKILVTPHIASFPNRAARARFVADAIRTFEASGTVLNRYDPARGY